MLFLEAQWEQRTVPFATLMDICHLKKTRSWNRSFKRFKAGLCSEVTLWKTIQEPNSVFYWTRLVCVSNDGRKNDGSHCKTTRLCRTNSRRSISLHSGNNGAPKWLKIPKSECPDIWIRLPRHKWRKSWANIEDPVVHLERNLCGHPLAGPLWERQFEKVPMELVWEKVPNWECFLFIENMAYSCRYTWMT